jgi:hypothetical protein
VKPGEVAAVFVVLCGIASLVAWCSLQMAPTQ